MLLEFELEFVSSDAELRTKHLRIDLPVERVYNDTNDNSPWQ